MEQYEQERFAITHLSIAYQRYERWNNMNKNGLLLLIG